MYLEIWQRSSWGSEYVRYAVDQHCDWRANMCYSAYSQEWLYQSSTICQTPNAADTYEFSRLGRLECMYVHAQTESNTW